MKLTEDQLKAQDEIKGFILSNRREHILTGESGSGKSTLVKHIVDELPNYLKAASLVFGRPINMVPRLTATTNEAATVLSDLTHNIPAQTFYKLFGFFMKNNYETGELDLVTYKGKLQRDAFIVIDEASMLRPAERKAILDFCGEHTKILYVMDNEQLGVVKGKCTLMEQGIPTSRLTSNMRQNGNDIAKLGLEFRDAVKTGVLPPLSFEDSEHIKYLKGDDFEAAIVNDFVTNPVDNVKVVTYTNAKTTHYNNLLRKHINGDSRVVSGEYLNTNSAIVVNGEVFAKNNSTVEVVSADEHDTEQFGITGQAVTIARGDEHISGFIAKDPKKAKRALNKLSKDKNWTAFFEMQEAILDLRPRYASTTYKVQGQTLDSVYIDLEDIATCRNVKEIARTMYVAATRAKRRVYFRVD